MKEFQEIRKTVGKPLDGQSVFVRLERLRRNAKFITTLPHKNDDRVRVRKTVGGSR